MDITIVSSMVGAGLEREYLLLRELLMSEGHYVMGVHYTDMSGELHPSKIMISFEVVSPRTLNIAKENWLFPNSEWWDPKNDQFLHRFTKILCKTQDCYDIWCRKVGAEKCVYTSFESRDLYNPDIPRELKCLHVAGKSEHKNTQAVANAWSMPHPGQAALPPLTIIARAPCIEAPFVSRKMQAMFPDNNVTFMAKATDEQIVEFMNSHAIHVIPSMYEGFGHIIHEGLGCGAHVITTDARPMNTYEGILKSCVIPVSGIIPRSLAHLNQVYAPDVERMVRKAVDLYHSAWGAVEQRTYARESFLRNRDFFRRTFMELVNAVK